MSEEKKQTSTGESSTSDESLADDALDQASGGQASGDYNLWRRTFGSQPATGEELNKGADELKGGDASASDPEWKYVPVRRTT